MKKRDLLRLAAALLALVLCAAPASVFALDDDGSEIGGEPLSAAPIEGADEETDDVPVDSMPLPQPTPIIVMPDDPVPYIEDPDVPIIIVEPTPFIPPVCPIPEDHLEFYTPGDMDLNGSFDSFDVALLLQHIAGIPRANWTDSKSTKVGDAAGSGKLSVVIRGDGPDEPEGMTFSTPDGVVDMTDVLQVLYFIDHPEMPVMGIYEDIPVCKPVIYLYPTETTDVTVTLGDEGALTCVYPAYDGGWTVTAEPDGTLTGPTGREYYSLYYEADMTVPDAEEGFVVPKDDVSDFLEEKLAVLGLTDREAEEMIIYWLPRLTQYDYVFIRFATRGAADTAMPLDISPAPDTVIRVWMLWRGLDEPVDVPAQELPPVTREGFTAVEWGGAELSP